ncbi:MAG TPA: patatin-like phospholipase family protein [Archangium sp.]|nr:patatin-like phospholipase family protein [Archangium sp.]
MTSSTQAAPLPTSAPEVLFSNAQYQDPPKQCDLIMKGGVTSGVVYPRAVLELARRYRFRSVGGTSAGAIAAAATAAAEYGREKPRTKAGSVGFQGLAQLMEELQKDKFLASLFQPAPETHLFLDTFLKVQKVLGTRKEAKGGWLSRLGLRSRLSWLLLQPLLTKPLRLRRGVRHLLARDESLFGLCTGMEGVSLHEEKFPALIPWLHERLQQLAGLDSRDVLTLGRLRQKQTKEGEDVAIYFQMVTTNLSQRQPYTLHGEDLSVRATQKNPADEIGPYYLFRGSDMEKLFPQEVVDYLKTWMSKRENQLQVQLDKPYEDFQLPDGYFVFPQCNALPVLVATRMSLSFPVLLSAVRLYSIRPALLRERTRMKEMNPRALPLVLEQGDLEENWFSDGGIVSNFPIHMFDAWIPTRPTFGINLADSQLPASLTGPREAPIQNGKGDVFLPRPDQVLSPKVYEVPSFLGFLGTIFDTAQNYRDNTQSRMPSYRERVVHVGLTKDEGGLNLDMPPRTIQGIADKGLAAAKALEDFDFEQHLWVRLLVLQARLEREFDALRESYEKAVERKGLDRSRWATHMYREYCKLQKAQREASPPWYKEHDEVWCKEAQRRMKMLIRLISTWGVYQQRWELLNPAQKQFFAYDEPTPEGILRVTPEH